MAAVHGVAELDTPEGRSCAAPGMRWWPLTARCGREAGAALTAAPPVPPSILCHVARSVLPEAS